MEAGSRQRDQIHDHEGDRAGRTEQVGLNVTRQRFVELNSYVRLFHRIVMILPSLLEVNDFSHAHCTDGRGELRLPNRLGFSNFLQFHEVARRMGSWCVERATFIWPGI
jgi:hypothetical protein